MSQLLCDDVIATIIQYSNLDTLLAWRRVSNKCVKVANDAFKIQDEYRVVLARQIPNVLTVDDNMLNLQIKPDGMTLECEVANTADGIIMHADVLSTMYFHPDEVLPVGFRYEQARTYVSMSLLVLLECCEVALKPDYVHVCRECHKLYKRVSIITELEKIDDNKCTSCRKTTKLVCAKCRTKIHAANYKFVVRVLRNYAREAETGQLLSIIRGMCEPHGQLVEFLKHHCTHAHEHVMMFAPDDD